MTACRRIGIKAAVLLVLAGPSTAQAAKPTGRLALACQGTTTTTDLKTRVEKKPEPISMGIIVDFPTRRVEFPDAHFPIQIIQGITKTAVNFYGNSLVYASTIDGTIDRVTGAVEATLVQHARGSDDGPHLLTSYSLKCKPT